MIQQTQAVTQVSRKDLPQSCPPKGASGWSEHPVVFLEIKKSGKAVCKYCGAQYELVD